MVIFQSILRFSLHIMTNLSFSLLAEYTQSECQQDKNSLNVVTFPAIITGFAIAVINSIIVYLIVCHKDLHKPIFIYICNAAIADLFSGVLLTWIYGLQKIVLPFRQPQFELIQNSFWYVTAGASLLNQLVIAIHRYSVIKGTKTGHECGRKELKRWTIFGLAMTWAIPLLFFFLPVNTTWNCLKDCNCYYNNNDTEIFYMFCAPLEHCSLTNPPFTRTSILYLGLFLVIMPIISCVLYIEIFKMVNQSRKKCTLNNTPNSISADQEFRNSSNQFYRKVLGPNSTKKSRPHSQHASFSSESLASSQSSNKFSSLPRSASIQNSNASRNGRKGSRIMSTIFLKDESIPAILERIPSAPEIQIERKSLSVFMKVFSVVMSKQSSMSKREISLLRTLVLILFCYTVSTVPLGSLFLASYNEVDKGYLTTLKAFIIISLINVLANPVIYLWRFNEIKRKFKKLFVCKK